MNFTDFGGKIKYPEVKFLAYCCTKIKKIKNKNNLKSYYKHIFMKRKNSFTVYIKYYFHGVLCL